MTRTIGRRAVGAILLAACPTLTHAQTDSTHVPAIARAAATAEAAVGGPLAPDQVTRPSAAMANAAAVSTVGQQPPASGTVPPSMPPPINLVSPSAPLDEKEQQAVAIAGRWANRRTMPHPGKDGVIHFLYGATLPTVVCAPLHVCDLALQPGEIVNNVNVGDKVRWNVSPGTSGSPAGEITHLIIKPTDAGLVSSMTIETNQRTYAVKLISTEDQWMPLIGFNYPDDTERQWSAYQRRAAWAAAASTLPSGQNIANLDFGFRLSGDDPAWRPLRVYTDGAKTYIQFPRAMAFGAAPALVGLDNGRHWFSPRSRRMVNYRVTGDRYIVDSVLDRAELVSGVGDDQTRVLITRDGAR